MIRLHTRRAGLIVIAVTVDDHLVPTVTWALTTEGATRRLLRRLDRATR